MRPNRHEAIANADLNADCDDSRTSDAGIDSGRADGDRRARGNRRGDCADLNANCDDRGASDVHFDAGRSDGDRRA